jgi:DNA-binding transcriptional ArsR family regulator
MLNSTALPPATASQTRTRKAASRPGMTHASDADDLNEVFEKASDLFTVMASPARLKIMHFLCDGEKSVNDLRDFLSSRSQSNVSQHLALMYRAGIVGKRRDGTTIFYRIVSPEAVAVCRTVCTQIAIDLAA